MRNSLLRFLAPWRDGAQGLEPSSRFASRAGEDAEVAFYIYVSEREVAER